MPPDFFDPTPEQQNVVLIDVVTLPEAERLIESCEACNWSVTDYILEEPAKCPNCRRDVLEKTLIEPA